jgi:hypothetical protein
MKNQMSQLREYRTNQSLFQHNNTPFSAKTKIFALPATALTTAGKKSKHT